VSVIAESLRAFRPGIQGHSFGAIRECAPEFLADQSGDHRALADSVIVGDRLEHAEVTLRRRERSWPRSIASWFGRGLHSFSIGYE